MKQITSIIAMPMYNLIEYSDNCSDTPEGLWKFKRDEIGNNANVNVANSSLLSYKSNFVGNTDNNGDSNGAKIAMPLKYLSNIWRSLEISLINCKVEISLTWIENYALATSVNIASDAIVNAVKATFKIKDAEIYVPVATLTRKDNVKLTKQFSERFRRSVYFSKHKVILNKNKVGTNDNPKYIKQLLDSSYQGIKRLFVLAYNNVDNNANKVDIISFKK